MNRRELIKKASMALGYSLSAPTIMGILNGCEPTHYITFAPEFFNEKQGIIVEDLSEAILPRTTTPGAKDLGVPSFIDSFVKNVYNKEDQDKFLKGIEEFNLYGINRYMRTFLECTHDLQFVVAKEVHTAVMDEKKNKSKGWWNDDSFERPFIMKMKELTILGYYTSEAGATEVLQYNQSPGPYQGCVPLEKVGRPWAT